MTQAQARNKAQGIGQNIGQGIGQNIGQNISQDAGLESAQDGGQDSAQDSAQNLAHDIAELAGRLQQRNDDLRQAQTVLQERDVTLLAMVQGIRDYAIFTLDTAGCITSWYRGAELMKGYTAAEAIGQPFALMFLPEDRERGLPAAVMAAAERHGEFKAEGQRMRKDGSRFEAAVVLTALRDAEGRLRGFIKLTQDISARRRIEREREHMLRDAQLARAAAEQATRSKGEFLATISHELRTPLAAIMGWAQVLESGRLDADKVQSGLAAIARNARVQMQMIEDLLDMNRIEMGQLRLNMQRIEMGSVLAAAVEAVLPSAQAKGIAVQTNFGTGASTVMGDSARLAKALSHLLANAIKFTPPGGHVSVGLTCGHGSVQVLVADDGQGIEARFLPRLFERFQQQDATITRHHGGLGVGLAIVRHVVELHGGTVQAQSAGVDRGASFTLHLPPLPALPALPAAAGDAGTVDASTAQPSAAERSDMEATRTPAASPGLATLRGGAAATATAAATAGTTATPGSPGSAGTAEPAAVQGPPVPPRPSTPPELPELTELPVLEPGPAPPTGTAAADHAAPATSSALPTVPLREGTLASPVTAPAAARADAAHGPQTRQPPAAALATPAGASSLSRRAQDAAAPAPPSATPERLDGVCVLLVDDAADLREVTAQLLQQAGARVVEAGSALEALRMLDQSPADARPDVLLSDIGMPGIDGYELLRRVRQRPAAAGGTIPAAAFTAYARSEDVTAARAAGYQLHLAKPVAASALVAALAALAGKPGPRGSGDDQAPLNSPKPAGPADPAVDARVDAMAPAGTGASDDAAFDTTADRRTACLQR